MSGVKRTMPGVEVEREAAERMSADDLATAHAAELAADALVAQRLAAARQGQAPKGRCANCGEVCAPLAVYCDEDCRGDHERRVRARARQGLAS